MGNLLKKVTSTVSVLAIAASAMGATASVSAASEFLAYADMLAKSGVINSTTEANYRLGDTITRAEVAKIAVKLSGVEMYDCVGDVFSDVGTSFDKTLCSAIETAAAEGFVNANADKFRPTDKVTRAELVKMLLAANGVEPSDVTANFKDIASIGDLAGYINAGVEIGAIKDGEYFRPNANATRGEAFKIASVVMDSVEPTTPPTSTGTTSTGSTKPTTSTGTTSTGVVTAGGLSISMASSAMQYVPSIGTVEAGKVSFAASASDVTVKSITLKRGGLGNRSDIDSVWFEYNGKKVSTESTVNSDETVTLSFTPSWTLKSGMSADLTLVVKLVGASGGQHNFAIVAAKDVSSTASTLTAMFPIVSNTLVTTNYTTTQINFESVSGVNQGDIKAGEKNVLLGEFKVSSSGSNNRDVVLTNVRLYNSGSLDTKFIGGLSVYSKATGTKVSSDVMVDGRNIYITVNDAIAYTNSTRTYEVRGDIVGIDRSNETLQLSFDNRNENITVKEISTGYRAATTLTTSKQNLYSFNVKGGSLSLITTSTTSNVDVAAGQSDVVLAKGTITAKEQTKLRDLTLKLTALSGSAVDADKLLTRVRIVVGGTTITVDPAQFKAATGIYQIRNQFIVDAGVSDFVVTADTRADAPKGSSVELAPISLSSVGDASTVGFNEKRYTSNDQVVADAYGTLSAVKVTIKGAGITISNQSPSATKIVGGAKNVSLLKYTLNNNDVSDITVTSEKFDVSVATASGTADLLKDMTVDFYINGTLVDSKAVPATTVGASSTGTVSFSKSYKVAKSSSATVELKTAIVPRFANGAVVTVTRKTESSSLSDANGNAAVVANANISSYGLTVANASADIAVSTNDKATLLIAQNGSVELGKFRIRATNDDIMVKELYATASGTKGTGSVSSDTLSRLIQTPTLVDAAGTVVAYGTVISNSGTAYIKFNNFVNSSFKIAKDTDAELSINASVAKLGVSDSGIMVAMSAGVANGVDVDADSSNVADNAARLDGSIAVLTDADVGTSTGTTKQDLITSGKLIVAAAGISDAGAGKVKFTITNNGTDSVMVKNLFVSSSTGTVTLYKGETASTSEMISSGAVSATSGAAIDVNSQSTKLEILAGQTVTILADFDGTASGDNNTINTSVNDVAYFDKEQGDYATSAITSIKSYNGTGLPASTSFSRSAGTY